MAESATLVLLAATLLVFRTFRERYLLIWILGWVAHLVSVTNPPGTPHSPLELGIAQAEFVLSVSLFALGALVYCHPRKFLSALLVFSLLLVAFAFVRELQWPDSDLLRMALEVGYRLLALAATLQLIRFRWARWEIGSWLLAVSLLLMHLDWPPLTANLPPGFSLVSELLLGLSMLLVVLDDSRVRTQRLSVVNALTTSITRAREQGPMMATALEELKRLMLAKAAWFRMVEGERMVIVQQIGLSQEFVHDAAAVPIG